MVDERTVREAARKHALFNALKYDGDASVDAVIGAVMQEGERFRTESDTVTAVVPTVVADVNDMSRDDMRTELADVDEGLLRELDADDEEADAPLPPLPNAEDYDNIRMRVAPNPNGPWHIGHARMPAVIGTYKQMYDGWFACRFDDTDPETKRPSLDAYDAILDAIEYLGFEPDRVVNASDRVETYYDYGRELIELGGAYTCSCPAETLREHRRTGTACAHRSKSAATTLDEFNSMVDGEYESGEMVLRVRTDMEHKNPALRDWVAFRVIDTPHPRDAAAEYRCWPSLDFQSGIDDHDFSITHIIRGIDLQDSAKRQQFVYDYFDWEYPEVLHWGHVQVPEYNMSLSTSTLLDAIDDGTLQSWDDPRAPTLASLRRRGIRGDAIVDAMVSLGTSKNSVDLSMDAIYTANRERVDAEANRCFLVREPYTRLPVVDGPDRGTPPKHPDFEDRGVRTIPVDDAVYVEDADVPAIGNRVWLKGYGCFRYTDDGLVQVDADTSVIHEEGVPVVHWVAGDTCEVLLRTPDGDVRGLGEPSVHTLSAGEMIQFERVGFARIDRTGSSECTAYLAHK